ncbi:sensor histidine kinase [Amycolatopsis sp. cmx-4-61]|uniref:sensor histidine kinase n=1 Tax=Amycolatopsis sp. cmx-4-61 TaxID=2790937 RepID=UPI00397C71C0
MTQAASHRRTGWRPRAADAGLVVLTLCPPLLLQPSADGSARAWWLLAAFEVVAAVALLVRRRWPLAAFLLLTGALVAAVTGGAAAGAKLTPLVCLSLAVALYGVGSLCDSWRRSALTALGGSALVAAGVWVNHLTTTAGPFRGGADVLAVLAPMPLAWATGFAARNHRENLAATEQRVEDVVRAQRLREQQAAQRERVRIAGEMHDVVAHSLTLLVVQAEILRARRGELPDWARGPVDGLAGAGRQAGGELRDLLRILRDPDDPAPLNPVPGLGDLPGLLDRSRAAGTPVDARIEAEVAALPRPTQLAVYRIVQESLTNARRHSPGAPVHVTIAEEAGWLRCEVVNARPAEPGARSWGTGLGLVGMRERVDVLDGELHAGPTADGGFRVSATLPRSGVSPAAWDTAGA